jgi:hypothetical protein
MRIPILFAREPKHPKDTHSNGTQDSPADARTYSQRIADQRDITPYQEQHRTTEQYYWKEQLRLAKKLNCLTSRLNRITIWGIVVASLNFFFLWWTLDETRRQANIADQTFRATQSAAVYLGLPDGKLADFLLAEKGLYIRLFFRNTGPTTALPPDKHVPGPDIPPGSPYTEYLFYSDATREELESKKKYLQIIGRITYNDIFGDHCEAFTLDYNAPPIEGFKFATEGSPDRSKICGTKEYTITSGVIVLQPGVPQQLFPFPVPPAQDKKQRNE